MGSSCSRKTLNFLLVSLEERTKNSKSNLDNVTLHAPRTSHTYVGHAKRRSKLSTRKTTANAISKLHSISSSELRGESNVTRYRNKQHHHGVAPIRLIFTYFHYVLSFYRLLHIATLNIILFFASFSQTFKCAHGHKHQHRRSIAHRRLCAF